MGNMNGHASRGFTIIEVVLFLSITGLMVAGLMVGTGAAISRQRYNDAVSSLQSDLQALYSNADSVAIDREPASCTAIAPGGVPQVSITTGGGTVTSRGQSNCIVMGRAAVIDGVKGQVSSYDIVGIVPVTSTATDDIGAISEYAPTLYKKSRQDTPIQWKTSVYTRVGDGSTYARGAYIYVVKSPKTGATYTFSQSSSPSGFTWQDEEGDTQPISATVFAANSRNQVEVGIDPCGLVSDASSMKVRIAPLASSTSAVTLTQQTGALPSVNERGCS